MSDKNILAFLIVVPALLCLQEASAQRLIYGVNIGYATVKYAFPVETNRYSTADIALYNTVKAGASIHFAVTNSFRIGTGVEYMSVSGRKDGGRRAGSAAIPNSTGQITFEVDNSLLVFPVDFRILLLQKNMVRPVLSAGLLFFEPLDQNVVIHVVPDNPDPYYEEMKTEINSDTPSSYFGGRLGVGAMVSPFEKHELCLMIYRNFNKSRYETNAGIRGDFEKHEITFNMWELAVAWSFR